MTYFQKNMHVVCKSLVVLNVERAIDVFKFMQMTPVTNYWVVKASYCRKLSNEFNCLLFFLKIISPLLSLLFNVSFFLKYIVIEETGQAIKREALKDVKSRKKQRKKNRWIRTQWKSSGFSSVFRRKSIVDSLQ